MSATDSSKPSKIRRDGWTAERQLRFLDAPTSTRSVAKASAFAATSREGAYRLRNRSEGTLLALLWDRALAPDPSSREVHTQPLPDGRLTRLLGTHYWRQRGDFLNIGGQKGGRELRDPQGTKTVSFACASVFG